LRAERREVAEASTQTFSWFGDMRSTGELGRGGPLLSPRYSDARLNRGTRRDGVDPDDRDLAAGLVDAV
jgi:hypothetical protein